MLETSNWLPPPLLVFQLEEDVPVERPMHSVEVEPIEELGHLIVLRQNDFDLQISQMDLIVVLDLVSKIVEVDSKLLVVVMMQQIVLAIKFDY